MILTKTYECIRKARDVAGLRVVDIWIGSLFSGVQVSDGSVGVAANYSRPSPCVSWEELASEHLSKSKADPLLEQVIYDSASSRNLIHCLRTCIVSALSRPLLVYRPQNAFESFAFSDLLVGVESAKSLVVGWGGLLTTFLQDERIVSVHVTDLLYATAAGRTRIDKDAKELIAKYPGKALTVSDGSDYGKRVRNCDICSITASSLCNNTCGELLRQAADCPKVILQGQSGAIYPEYLFEQENVDVLITTVKPDNILHTARNQPETFRQLVEGGLPWIQLRPVKKSGHR